MAVSRVCPIPTDCLISTFSFLDAKDVVASFSVCSSWKSIETEEFWQILIQRDFPFKLASKHAVSNRKAYFAVYSSFLANFIRMVNQSFYLSAPIARPISAHVHEMN